MSEINALLAEIQQKLNAPKGQFNSFGKYPYRSCEDIVEAVKPLLNGATLIISDEIVMVGDRYYVKATASLNLSYEPEPKSGPIYSVAYAREAEEKKGMDVAQITGAASSYARKYALNGLFAIDDTKDADTKDNRQVSPDPIDLDQVLSAVQRMRELIDLDRPEDTAMEIAGLFHGLSPDEKVKVGELMSDKAPDSKKMYKTLLKDHLNYKGEQHE